MVFCVEKAKNIVAPIEKAFKTAAQNAPVYLINYILAERFSQLLFPFWALTKTILTKFLRLFL